MYTKVKLGEGVGVRAPRPQDVRSLRVHAQELDHLHLGEVRAPAGPGAQAGEQVVQVHGGVDQRVGDDREVHVPVVRGHHHEPVRHEDGRVVVAVEEAGGWGGGVSGAGGRCDPRQNRPPLHAPKLLPFAPVHDEEGVHEIENLGEVKHPHNLRRRQ